MAALGLSYQAPARRAGGSRRLPVTSMPGAARASGRRSPLEVSAWGSVVPPTLAACWCCSWCRCRTTSASGRRGVGASPLAAGDHRSTVHQPTYGQAVVQRPPDVARRFSTDRRASRDRCRLIAPIWPVAAIVSRRPCDQSVRLANRGLGGRARHGAVAGFCGLELDLVGSQFPGGQRHKRRGAAGIRRQARSRGSEWGELRRSRPLILPAGRPRVRQRLGAESSELVRVSKVASPAEDGSRGAGQEPVLLGLKALSSRIRASNSARVG